MGLLIPLIVGWSLILGIGAYYKGRESRSPEVEELQIAIKSAEIVAKEAANRAEKASAREVIVYKDRIKVIKEQIPGDIQLVEVIKRDSNCIAPPSFRVLHDRAASGRSEVKDSTGTDAAPVPIEDIAATVAENYRIAAETAARLSALQAILNSQ